MLYYDQIYHSNTTDAETLVYSKTSTEEERYRIVEVRIYKETNPGILKFYREREHIATAPTGSATISNYLRYETDIELPIGYTFRITLQNRTPGTNASIHGVVVYEIVK